jgi:hypothetical protein
LNYVGVNPKIKCETPVPSTYAAGLPASSTGEAAESQAQLIGLVVQHHGERVEVGVCRVIRQDRVFGSYGS